MEELDRLTELLNLLNTHNGRYEADYDISKKSVRVKVYRNDDGVTVLPLDTEPFDADYEIEIKAAIAYLEVLKESKNV